MQSQEQRGPHPPDSSGQGGRIKPRARTHPGGVNTRLKKEGVRLRAQAGEDLTRVRPDGLAEDRVRQTASALAGP